MARQRAAKGPARVAVEAGVTDGWHQVRGHRRRVIGVNRFGESAPAGELFKYFGITTEAVVAAVKKSHRLNRHIGQRQQAGALATWPQKNRFSCI